MEKQLKREEIDNKYKWNLSSIYKDELEYQKEIDVIKDKINLLNQFKRFNNEKDLYEYLEYNSLLCSLIDKASVYTNCLFNSETTNATYLKMQDDVHQIYILYKEKNAKIIKELQKLTKGEINDYYLNNTKLLKYKHDLDEFLREKKHLLSKKEELILANFSKSFSLPYEAYETLTDTDFKFGNIKVEDNVIELTDSNYIRLITNNNQEVRKQAFEMMHKKHAKYCHTLAKLLNAEVDTNKKIAKIRKYKNAMELFLFNDNVNEQIVTNLIKNVRKNAEIIKDYYHMKKQLLKLDKLHVYDLYVNVFNNNKKYLYDDSKSILKSALEILGNDYAKTINKAFDEGWIDVYNNIGKRSGAYSTGSYLTKPYVLLNYENDYHSLSTLAHELGHSLHTYYSIENNTPNNYNYSIFIAEIASLVNELLLNKYLIDKSTEKNEKMFYLSELIELYRGTLIRQVMFSEFEYNIYQGENIKSSEEISNMYYDLCKKYLTDEVDVDELIKYEWARVPHFYYNFYVYKYSIGISIATYIVKHIEEPNFKDKYIKLLKSGGSDYPLELLKIIDIDLSDNKVFDDTFDYLKDLIEKYKKEVINNE